jgi:hypothetical protein
MAGFQKESKLIDDFLKAAPDNLPIILLKHIPSDLESISRSRVGSATVRAHSQWTIVSF